MDRRRWLCLSMCTVTAPLTAIAAPLPEGEAQKLLEEVDRRRNGTGDYHARVYLERAEQDRSTRAFRLSVYRRAEDRKLVLLFLEPRSEAGKGYLRIENNLFAYDPNVGRWERRTVRERISGTDSRTVDFEDSRLALDYTARSAADEVLGRFQTARLELIAREGADVPFPAAHAWIDRASGNLLKLREHGASGKAIRTSFYPRWETRTVKARSVVVPMELRVVDEVDKGNRTLVTIEDVDLSPLPTDMFSKAWLESRSR